MVLPLDAITAKAGTNDDQVHVAGTGGRSRGLVQVQGPNTIITVEVAAKAGWYSMYHLSAHLLHMKLIDTFIHRERKKKTERVRRKSRSRTASPPSFRARNTAMDAQEALARRQDSVSTIQSIMCVIQVSCILCVYVSFVLLDCQFFLSQMTPSNLFFSLHCLDKNPQDTT